MVISPNDNLSLTIHTLLDKKTLFCAYRGRQERRNADRGCSHLHEGRKKSKAISVHTHKCVTLLPIEHSSVCQ